MRLANLSAEELYVLLTKLRHVHASGDRSAYALPDESLHQFMRHCSDRIGEAYFRTPRSTIRAFVQLLMILNDNPEIAWADLIGNADLQDDTEPSISNFLHESGTSSYDDELVSLKL